MYGPPGMAYVYLSYGVHYCLNAVTEPAGRAGAVLLRALEPLHGLAAMRGRRGRCAERALCAGPGCLCRALGIDLAWNGLPLAGRVSAAAKKPAPRRVWMPAGTRPRQVAIGPRVGIRRAVNQPYRFCDPDSPCLSRPPGNGRF